VTGVVRGEGALELERAKVCRIALGRQVGARRVLVRGANIEVGAAKDRARLVEEPDARALDLQRLGDGLGDGANGEIEVAGVKRVVAREIDEDAVLTP